MQGRQTEQMSAEYVGLDTWPDERALAAMLEAQSRGVAAVRDAFADISKAAALVADKIRGGGRLIYAGAGSSGLIAKLDAHELPSTFGIPHKPGAGADRRRLGQLRPHRQQDGRQRAAGGRRPRPR